MIVLGPRPNRTATLSGPTTAEEQPLLRETPSKNAPIWSIPLMPYMTRTALELRPETYENPFASAWRTTPKTTPLCI